MLQLPIPGHTQVLVCAPRLWGDVTVGCTGALFFFDLVPSNWGGARPMNSNYNNVFEPNSYENYKKKYENWHSGSNDGKWYENTCLWYKANEFHTTNNFFEKFGHRECPYRHVAASPTLWRCWISSFPVGTERTEKLGSHQSPQPSFSGLGDGGNRNLWYACVGGIRGTSAIVREMVVNGSGLRD